MPRKAITCCHKADFGPWPWTPRSLPPLHKWPKSNTWTSQLPCERSHNPCNPLDQLDLQPGQVPARPNTPNPPASKPRPYYSPNIVMIDASNQPATNFFLLFLTSIARPQAPDPVRVWILLYARPS